LLGAFSEELFLKGVQKVVEIEDPELVSSTDEGPKRCGLTALGVTKEQNLGEEIGLMFS